MVRKSTSPKGQSHARFRPVVASQERWSRQIWGFSARLQYTHINGELNRPHQNVPLRCVDHFELKAFETQKTQEKLSSLP